MTLTFKSTEKDSKRLIQEFLDKMGDTITYQGVSSVPVLYEFTITYSIQQKESWRVVEDFPEYQVSNLGRVIKTPKPKMIRAYKGADGDHVVFSDKKVKRASFKVAKLVAKAFVPNPEDFKLIGFRDMNPENITAENIYWTNKNGQFHKQ